MKKHLTAERCRRLFMYDKHEMELYWKTNTANRDTTINLMKVDKVKVLGRMYDVLDIVRSYHYNSFPVMTCG